MVIAMNDKCLFLDTTLAKFYNKAHCGVYCMEITKEHYCEYCLTEKFIECPYFKRICEKIFAYEEDE